MSYLQLDKGLPDFSKLVLSLWFRVPLASFNAAAEAWRGDDQIPFDGIIPLVVFGNTGKNDPRLHITKQQVVAYEQTGYNHTEFSFSFDYEIIGQCEQFGPYSMRVESTARTNVGTTWVSAEPYHGYLEQETISPAGPASDSNPSFIGVDISGRLVVNFETTQVPVVSGYSFNETIAPGPTETAPINDSFEQGTVVNQWCHLPLGLLVTPIPGTEEEVSNDMTIVPAPDGTSSGEPVRTYTDISDVVLSATGAIYSDVIEVAEDHWHHLLVSVELQTVDTHGGDFTGSIAEFVDSASKLFIAVDDVNYTEWNLTSNWTERDPNETITDGAFEIAGARPATDFNHNVIGIAHYTLAGPKVPNGGEPLGLPATRQFVDKIFPVELAELQIFTGVSLDTGRISNRRAFIDADGYPVSPVGETPPAVEGEPPPVPEPGPAETLLGKKPEILLHGSGNWIAGRNTGGEPSGSIDPITGEPTDKPGEDLTPTGWIINYTPEPSLKGPQMPEAEPAVPARETVT